MKKIITGGVAAIMALGLLASIAGAQTAPVKKNSAPAVKTAPAKAPVVKAVKPSAKPKITAPKSALKTAPKGKPSAKPKTAVPKVSKPAGSAR